MEKLQQNTMQYQKEQVHDMDPSLRYIVSRKIKLQNNLFLFCMQAFVQMKEIYMFVYRNFSRSAKETSNTGCLWRGERWVRNAREKYFCVKFCSI